MGEIAITGRNPMFPHFFNGTETQSIMFPRHLSFAETFYTKSWRFYQVLILMHQIKCKDLSLFGLRS